MNAKKINRMNKKQHNKLKRRMKPRRRQRKLKLKPENLLELKELRNFWLLNKYLTYDFDPSWLYYFDPYTYKSTRHRNNSPEYHVCLKTAKQSENQLYSESENIIDYIDLTNDDDSIFISSSSSGSSSSSSSTDFSEFSFHSLSSMTDPLEDL